MIYPSAGEELDLPRLAEVYAYPGPRWLRVNFVSSADGAATVDSLSGGLSSADDKRVFGILRVLTDLVLVGAGTARAEQYKPARRREALTQLRARPPAGGADRAGHADPRTEPEQPAVHRGGAGLADHRDHLRVVRRGDAAETAKVADVIVAGDDTVDLRAALDELAGRGLGRVLCEGGPHLFGDLFAAGLVDELCLSLGPTLAGPGASRIIAGEPSAARPLTLRQVIADDEGFLFCRYLAAEQEP